MPANRLERTYVLRGLDRVLYSSPPQWEEGTFIQTEENEGCLVLWKCDIESPKELQEQIKTSDQIAGRFRLAISKRTGCPLTLTLKGSDEPYFDPPGVLKMRETFGFSDQFTCTVLPRNPPSKIEQLPDEAARWILTLAEARNFGTYADEILKRLYLLIEELQDEYSIQLGEDQKAALQQVKWVRDFVSHPTCHNKQLFAFIARHLPDAVIPGEAEKVRFDRTSVEHRNFVGRYEPIVRSIAATLLNAAIATLK